MNLRVSCGWAAARNATGFHVSDLRLASRASVDTLLPGPERIAAVAFLVGDHHPRNDRRAQMPALRKFEPTPEPEAPVATTTQQRLDTAYYEQKKIRLNGGQLASNKAEMQQKLEECSVDVANGDHAALPRSRELRSLVADIET